MNYNLITILGPTATGKTRLASLIANKFNGEIISADSRQVYKGMDIGSGKDISDYIVDGHKVPYHLIDVVNPEQEFNLYLFIEYFKKAFKEILSQNKIPVLAGGTGLYISSVVQNYMIKKAKYTEADAAKLSRLNFEELKSILLSVRPKVHNKTDLENKRRLIKAILVSSTEGEVLLKDFKIVSLVIGVKYERSVVRERITKRLTHRLNEGMVEEVQKLLESGVSYGRLLNFGLEYKFIALYLKGEINYDEMFSKLNTAIHAFAKRQMTWFRKMEREGVKINWIANGNFEEAADLIEKHKFVSEPKL
ncbi:MAG: tRNA (adenosine(37)-N6)-dimethylallyltransferase MiaA [Ignavibacteriales bacterium]|nr:MAG: tRNA (adenosine(37)-N6)-dimethylallyltransferase MiaA [Ignavibacteriales bacterium]